MIEIHVNNRYYLLLGIDKGDFKNKESMNHIYTLALSRIKVDPIFESCKTIRKSCLKSLSHKGISYMELKFTAFSRLFQIGQWGARPGRINYSQYARFEKGLKGIRNDY